MQEVLNIIRKRQSTRIPFDSERPVAKEGLRQILEVSSEKGGNINDKAGKSLGK